MSYEPWKVGQKVGQVRPPEPVLTRGQKLRRVLIGFLGWWLVNVPPWPLINWDPYADPSGISYCLLPISLGLNIMVLIIMARTNRWVALGLLAAFAANLVISLVLGLAANAACWVPFTTPIE